MPNASNQFARWLKRYWPAALIGSVWLWMFWPMIAGQTVCGFRDSAYLYYPLFKWIDSVWASGEIPLWNPYCNYGLPVVGDGSSSVFYPGKLIFLCRFLSYPSRYGIYLSVHVLIAAAGAYRFARTMKANQAGATLAAVSYAFGGSVLFQVTNVIYLVSAAWLPFALAFVWRGVLGGDWRSTVWAGVVCALMILGGDPQMVYHVGLIAAFSVLFRFWKRRRWLLKKSRSSSNESYRWLAIAGTRLMMMVIVTSSLAAIQILPTAHWAERSERAAAGRITNVVHAWKYTREISEPNLKSETTTWLKNDPPITYLDKTITRSLFGSHHPGSTEGATYQFSQPPWSIAELFFPNVMGKPFPTHQRWSDALPAAERIWTPSIYAGVLTILIALSQFRLWGKRKRHVWLSRIALFFAIASFGWFGVVWLLNEGLAVFGLSELKIGGIKIGPQVGGLYWFMVTFLPKYFMFRYPAKLFVITSLMISVLAGLGITHTSSTRKRVDLAAAMNPLACASSLYSGIIVGTVCVAALIALQIMPVESWLGRIRPNLFFGPMDIKGTASALSLSFAHVLIVITSVTSIIWLAGTKNRFETQVCSTGFSRNSLIFRLKAVLQTIQTGFETPSNSQRSSDSNASTFLAVSIVLLSAVDVTVANRWMLAEVDSNVFESPTKIGKQLEQLKADHPDSIPRIYRSFDVQARHQTWPRESSSNRLEEIITWRRETLFPKHHLEHNIALLGSFGSVWPTDYKHFPSERDLEFRSEGSIPETQLLGDQVAAQFVFDPDCDFLKLRPQTSGPVNNPRLVQAEFSGDGYHCHVLQNAYYDHAWNEIEQRGIVEMSHTLRSQTVEVEIEEPLRLVTACLHDSGWIATVEDLESGIVSPQSVHLVDGLWMQLKLKPGHQNVTFTYSPREFWIGCWISGVSLFMLLAFPTHRRFLRKR